MRSIFVVAIVLVALVLICAALVLIRRRNAGDVIHPDKNLQVTSEAFAEGGMMPVEYTGRGEDVSPPLNLGALSPQAKTIAVIMDDLDHPAGMFNHWVIWNIPANSARIPRAVPAGESVTSLGGALQGRSQYGGKHYYRGPKPPFGVHRYEFKVYVLDTVLELDASAGKTALQRAMQGHVLQYGTLTGVFGSSR